MDAKKGADYTNTFCYLMGEFDGEYKIFRDKDFSSWRKNGQNVEN